MTRERNPAAATRCARLFACAASTLILAACGGGGSGANTGETINGIAMPPAPDPATNKATLAGVDVNNNGVRDDVDRMLATEFGQNTSAYQAGVNYARTLQSALTAPTPAAVDAHVALIRCVRDDQRLDEFAKITAAMLDTSKRRGAYGDAFEGVVLSSKGCP